MQAEITGTKIVVSIKMLV